MKHHPYKYRFALISLLIVLVVFIISFTWGFSLGRKVGSLEHKKIATPHFLK